MGKLADIVVTITDMAVENTHVIASEMKSPLAILTSLYFVSRRIQDRRTINNLKENVITLQDIMNNAQNNYLSADEFKRVHSELLERLQNVEQNHKKKYFSDEVKDLLIRARFGDEDAIEGLMDIQHQQEDALQFVISGNSLGVGIESLLDDRRICTPMPAGSLYFSPGKIHIMSEKGQIYRAKPFELGIALKMQNEMMQKFGKEHSTLEEISLAGEVSFGVDLDVSRKGISKEGEARLEYKEPVNLGESDLRVKDSASTRRVEISEREKSLYERVKDVLYSPVDGGTHLLTVAFTIPGVAIGASLFDEVGGMIGAVTGGAGGYYLAEKFNLEEGTCFFLVGGTVIGGFLFGRVGGMIGAVTGGVVGYYLDYLVKKFR